MAPAALASGELRRRAQARRERGAGQRRRTCRLPPPGPEPPRPRSEGNPCPERLRRRSPSAPRPGSYPPSLLRTGQGRPQPRCPPGSLHGRPRARGRLRAYLRWSKEWMLRAAFPCPPPTQLRERPNMLAANGGYGPAGLYGFIAPRGRTRGRPRDARAGGERAGAPSAAAAGAQQRPGARAGGARREAPFRAPPLRRRADCRSQRAAGRGGARARVPQPPAGAGGGQAPAQHLSWPGTRKETGESPGSPAFSPFLSGFPQESGTADPKPPASEGRAWAASLRVPPVRLPGRCPAAMSGDESSNGLRDAPHLPEPWGLAPGFI